MEEEVKELIQSFEQDKGKRVFRYILSVSEDDEFIDFYIETYYVIAKDKFDFYLVSNGDRNKITSIGIGWSVNSPYQMNEIDIYKDNDFRRIILNLFTDKEKEDAINMIKEKFYEHVNKKEWYQGNDFIEKVNTSLCMI